MPADVIVWATGFDFDLRVQIAKLFGQVAADQTDQFYGLDAEGEIRGAWRFQRKSDSVIMRYGH